MATPHPGADPDRRTARGRDRARRDDAARWRRAQHLVGHAGRPVRGQGADRGLGRDAAGAHRCTGSGRPERGAAPRRGQAQRPERPVRADRRSRGLGRRRHRPRWTATGSASSSPPASAACSTLLASYDVLQEKGPRRVFPLAVPMLMPNGPAAHVGLELGARAGVHTPVSACASGAEAMAYAVDMIRSGRADVVVAGGTEAAIHPLPIAGVRRDAGAVDPQRRAGAAPRRPTTRAATASSSARAPASSCWSPRSTRGRAAPRIYAEIAGAGITSDAHHIAAPDPVGRRRGPRHADGARGDAGVSADRRRAHQRARDLDAGRRRRRGARDARRARRRGRRRCVSGDQVDDRAPARRGRRGRGDRDGAGPAQPPGAADRSTSRTPTTRSHLDVVRSEPRALPDGPIAALNNSFGFGGHNVALVVRSVDAVTRRPSGGRRPSSTRADDPRDPRLRLGAALRRRHARADHAEDDSGHARRHRPRRGRARASPSARDADDPGRRDGRGRLRGRSWPRTSARWPTAYRSSACGTPAVRGCARASSRCTPSGRSSRS